jgi:hypothetical protein
MAYIPLGHALTYPKLKKAQVTLSGKYFTPYITNHLVKPGQTNALNTDGWVTLNFY